MAFRFGRSYRSKSRKFADLLGVNRIFNDDVTAVTTEAVVDVVANTSIANTVSVTVTSNPTGTFGSASLIPVITVDELGRITNISNTNVAGVASFSYTTANNTLRIGTADGSNYTVTIQGLANTNYVDTTISNLVDSAPATLDTLNELAAALGDDANFSTTVVTNLGQRLGSTATVTLTGSVTASETAFSSNTVTLNTSINFDSSDITTSAESFANNDTQLLTAAAITDRILELLPKIYDSANTQLFP